MTRVDEYATTLRALAGAEAWEPYLRANSSLPGPRGNLELAHAFAQVAPAELIWRCAAVDAATAPTNTPGEFVAFCGVLALGPLAARGNHAAAVALAAHAEDMRWRVREAAATALQLWGDLNPETMLATAQTWSGGGRLLQRAVVAGVAEPRLLRSPAMAQAALELLDRVTASLAAGEDQRTDAQRVLRQALGYAWSVVIVAAPEAGKAYLARWAQSSHPDVQWLVRENLTKARLARMDAAWVAQMRGSGT